jgi:hypothetical protein
MKNKQESVSWSELVKKVVFTSLGSAAMAGKAVADSKVRGEVFSNVLSRAEKTKEDLMNVLAKEVSKFLGKINVSDEITKALKDLTINLTASLDFKDKKGHGLHPSVKIHTAGTRKRKR